MHNILNQYYQITGTWMTHSFIFCDIFPLNVRWPQEEFSFSVFVRDFQKISIEFGEKVGLDEWNKLLDYVCFFPARWVIFKTSVANYFQA